MTPKLACADFTFPLLSHDKALDLVALLDFEGVDIGLFEGRSHLWPSRVFQDLKGSARELSGKLRDRGLELADVFLQTAPDFTSVAPNHPGRRRTPTRASDWFQTDHRVRRRVRRAARLGPAGGPLRRGSRGRELPALLRRAGLALRGRRRAGNHVLGRGPRRLHRPDARRRRPARPVGPGSYPDARLHPLHPRRRPRRRGRAPPLPRQPLPRPLRPARTPPGVLQGQRHRLWPGTRRHGANRVFGVRRRRIRLDRLGALQRGRQPVGNDPDARLPPYSTALTRLAIFPLHFRSPDESPGRPHAARRFGNLPASSIRPGANARPREKNGARRSSSTTFGVNTWSTPLASTHGLLA